MFAKKLLGGAALTALSLTFGAGVAQAQSTGSQAQESETIVVTGAHHTINGAISAETVAKSRATISQQYIGEQTAGQSILQTINLVPGVNFTNNDPYGTSGGNLRMRGFDGPRISLTFDGVPLNDSGNYAIFSNQLLDPELITRASVNIGTTDVDSPSASAIGGTVNYLTRVPLDHFGVGVNASVGDDNYARVFGVVDTGQLGPWDTTAFGAASWQDYDKWKGPGSLHKQQYNMRIYQHLSGSDFISLSAHYNENRNNFYRNITLSQWQITPGLEEDIGCLRPTPGAGIQNETTGSTFIDSFGNPGTGSCTNYYNVRVNPSNTGNIRGASQFSFGDHLRLTVDPSFQYVLANGGGFTVTSEKDDRLDLAGGNAGGPGVDLNGDGDTLDSISLYTPNNTNTRRFGLNSSLIWDINDTNRLRLAYTFDDAHHRQTGEATFLDLHGNPLDVFGGKDGHGPTVNGVSGAGILQGRNRFSTADLNQLALEYRGQFMDNRLTVNLGVRAPHFTRKLHQMCYSQNGSTTVRCTNEPITATLADGNVTLSGGGATEFIQPYRAEFHFNDMLPNIGVDYKIGDHGTVYVSYAQGLSAPRTDNLYTPKRGTTPTSILFPTAQPETTEAWDLGYRYQSDRVILSGAVWTNSFQNRIVTSFDPDLGISVDRNVGDVQMYGFDAQVGVQISPQWTVYVAASETQSQLQDAIPLSATTALPTAGKELVETPDQMLTWRADWDPTSWLHMGLQGKYVGSRYTTDVNDQSTPAYHVWDFDARMNLGMFHAEHSYLQFNLTNLFDEKYIGGISSTNNANNIDVDPGPGVVIRTGLAPFLTLGAPRTALITLHTEF